MEIKATSQKALSNMFDNRAAKCEKLDQTIQYWIKVKAEHYKKIERINIMLLPLTLKRNKLDTELAEIRPRLI